MTIAVHVRERPHVGSGWHAQSRAMVLLEAPLPISVHRHHETGLDARIAARGHEIEVRIAIDVPQSERVVVVARLQLHDRWRRELTSTIPEKDLDGVPPTVGGDDV